MQILTFVGSFRKASYNQGLARALASVAPASVTFSYASIEMLPLYNADMEAAMPEAVVRLKKEVAASDAILFVTPEYNRSIPGGLKNAIDWISRPYGDNSFAGKPALVTGASTGAMGTSVAQSHLKHSLLYLDMHVMGQPEMYIGKASEKSDEQGNLVDEETKEFLRKSLESFVAWVNTHKK